MRYVVTINYNYIEKFFSNYEKTGGKHCFKPLISFVFTTVAARLKSEQKEKKKILTLYRLRFKLISP